MYLTPKRNQFSWAATSLRIRLSASLEIPDLLPSGSYIRHTCGMRIYRRRVPFVYFILNTFRTTFVHAYDSELSSTTSKFCFHVITFSNGQLRLRPALNPAPTLLVVQGRFHPLFDKFLHLLRCPTHEALRVKEGREILLNRVEVRVSLDALDEIVLETELLDLVGGFMRQDLQTVSQLRAPNFSEPETSDLIP